MLLPFFPRRPQRLAGPKSMSGPLPAAPRLAPEPVAVRWPLRRTDVSADEPILNEADARLGAPPPSMADTDRCCECACFWMAEVMLMHSDITSETGSTATDTGWLRYCMRDDAAVDWRSCGNGCDAEGEARRAVSGSCSCCRSSGGASALWVASRASRASLLIVRRAKGVSSSAVVEERGSRR